MVIYLHNIVFGAASGKGLIYRHFLEEGDRKDLEQCVEGGVEIEPFFDDGDEDVDRDGDPDLGFYSIFRRSVEPFDPQMLLDPLEEEFNLPAALIEGADGRGWQAELVGEENECLGGFGIAEAYPAQMLWIALGGVMTAECDGLIADDAGCAVSWGRARRCLRQLRL